MEVQGRTWSDLNLLYFMCCEPISGVHHMHVLALLHIPSGTCEPESKH
jgi:hypothetical protein